MSGSGQKSVTQTSTSSPPAFVIPFSQQLLSRASQVSNQPLQPALPSGEQQVAGLSNAEQLGLQNLTNQAQFGTPSLNAAEQGLAALIGPDAAFSPLTNQLVSSAQGNLVDQFNLNVAPAAAAQFARGGTFGSTANQELEAAQRFGLARSLSETESSIRDQALNRSLAASSLAPQLANQNLLNQQSAFNAGTQQRGIQQSINDVNLQNILAERQQPLTQLDILAKAIAAAQGGFGNSFATQTGGVTSNPFLGALGAGGAFLGGLGSLFGSGIFNSSKDYKKDKKPLHHRETLSKLESIPVEKWTYKPGISDSKEHIGPYAEDFRDAFEVGDGKSIAIVDAVGVGLSAIKGLAERVAGLENAGNR